MWWHCHVHAYFPYVASHQTTSSKKVWASQLSAIMHGTKSFSSMDISQQLRKEAISSTNQGEDKHKNWGTACIPTYISQSKIRATITVKVIATVGTRPCHKRKQVLLSLVFQCSSKIWIAAYKFKNSCSLGQEKERKVEALLIHLFLVCFK